MASSLRRQFREFRAVDLFSGCGGLTLGLKRAGFAVVGAVEIDPLSVDSYRANHPEVHIWQTDIQILSPHRVLEELSLEPGELELLAGCSPCQGFSRIRTLNGARSGDDPLNDLVLQIVRFVRVLRPKAVMLENVPALAEDQRFWCLYRELGLLGYSCDHRILDAADYGVPQRRRRVILLGSQLGPIAFARKARRRRTVRETISDLPQPRHAHRDPLHHLTERRADHVKALIRNLPKDGGSRRDLDSVHELECHRRCDGFSDVYGRMAWKAVAPTITSGFVNPSKGRFLHPSQNRAITLREAALLQSFPRRYKISLERGKYPAAVLIGNALPPEFIRRVAGPVRRQLEGASAARA